MDDYYYYGANDAMATGTAVLIIIFSIAVMVATLIGLWKVFKKAGYQGWESIVPFYNTYVLCDIVFGNGLLFLISFIPYVNTVFILVLYFKLAGVFNKSTAYGLGLVFLSPIFIIMLGMDSNAYYSGPSVKARSMSGGYGGSYGGGYGNAYGGGAGNYGGNQGYNYDYPTYGGNNQQGYPGGNQQQNGYQNNSYQQQNDYQQQNGYQNNGFQSQGQVQNNGFQSQNNGFQAQGFQRENPFEKQSGNDYYGNSSNYNSYNSYNSQNNNNGSNPF